MKQMNQKLFLENKDFQYKNQELITRIDEFQKNNVDLQCKVNELQNKIDELQNQIVRLAIEPKIINNTTNNNTTNNYLENNTTNNQFNLSMFLNEECKNAINLKDFVTSIDLKVEDLEETGRLGFIDGLTRIVVNELKKLDITERPIHCTDLKRETVYVKDQNQWNKDNAEKEHMFAAVNRIVYKNLKMIPIWQQKYPQYNSIEEQYQQYLNGMHRICLDFLHHNIKNHFYSCLRKNLRMFTKQKQSITSVVFLFIDLNAIVDKDLSNLDKVFTL